MRLFKFHLQQLICVVACCFYAQANASSNDCQLIFDNVTQQSAFVYVGSSSPDSDHNPIITVDPGMMRRVPAGAYEQELTQIKLGDKHCQPDDFRLPLKISAKTKLSPASHCLIQIQIRQSQTRPCFLIKK